MSEAGQRELRTMGPEAKREPGLGAAGMVLRAVGEHDAEGNPRVTGQHGEQASEWCGHGRRRNGAATARDVVQVAPREAAA